MLTEKGARGDVFSDEAAGSLTGKLTIGTTDYKTFKDTYGTPLTYARYATNGEINNAPFKKSGVASQDPFDPLNKLGASWNVGGTAVTPASVAAGLNLTNFDGLNWLPSIFCAGADKSWNNMNVSPTAVLPD